MVVNYQNFYHDSQILTTIAKVQPTPPHTSNIAEHIDLRLEFWWKLKRTCRKLKYNQPDKAMWNRKERLRTIVEVSRPLDINFWLKESEKLWAAAAQLKAYLPRIRFYFNH